MSDFQNNTALTNFRIFTTATNLKVNNLYDFQYVFNGEATKFNVTDEMRVDGSKPVVAITEVTSDWDGSMTTNSTTYNQIHLAGADEYKFKVTLEDANFENAVIGLLPATTTFTGTAQDTAAYEAIMATTHIELSSLFAPSAIVPTWAEINGTDIIIDLEGFLTAIGHTSTAQIYTIGVASKDARNLYSEYQYFNFRDMDITGIAGVTKISKN